MAVRDYEGNGIIVHWNAEACVHSARCVGGAPEVFDTAKRPWVTATAGTADTIAAVIDTCPSGALSYTRTDGGAHGRRGHGADEDPTAARRSDDEPAATDDVDVPVATVRLRRDGPLVVDGPVVLVGADGVTETHERLFLCRCGHSAEKPRCDGSHKRTGFTAPGETPAMRP
jgi:uncharacterized Fe-S cluster protein YjdI/CDGSH-type Zn-finger protein